MIQQLLGLPRVLAGNAVARPQHAQRPQRDVLKIADRRGNQVKPRRKRSLRLVMEICVDCRQLDI